RTREIISSSPNHNQCPVRCGETSGDDDGVRIHHFRASKTRSNAAKERRSRLFCATVASHPASDRVRAVCCSALPRLLLTFQCNGQARRFYATRGFLLIARTDDARNDEKEPDALYFGHAIKRKPRIARSGAVVGNMPPWVSGDRAPSDARHAAHPHGT